MGLELPNRSSCWVVGHACSTGPLGETLVICEALNWGQMACSNRVQQEVLLLWKSMASSGRRNKRTTKSGFIIHLPTPRCISKNVSLDKCKPAVEVRLKLDFTVNRTWLVYTQNTKYFLNVFSLLPLILVVNFFSFFLMNPNACVHVV